jgi:hypothetical protein
LWARPPKKLLRAENNRLKGRFETLNRKVKAMQEQMGELERRDNTVYRAFLKPTPSPTAHVPTTLK